MRLVSIPGCDFSLSLDGLFSRHGADEVEGEVTDRGHVGGGGGYGDPLERDPQLVVADVSEEMLTVDAAREQYGVVVRCVDADTAEWERDISATEAEREARRVSSEKT